MAAKTIAVAIIIIVRINTMITSVTISTFRVVVVHSLLLVYIQAKAKLLNSARR